MKYISVEKLKAEIKGLQCEQGFEDGETERGYQVAIKDILRIITSLQQEQPEVDLEKEIDAIWNPRFNLGWDEHSALSMNHDGFASIARHFYGLRNRALEEAARHVYESWMGGTMDDVRRDMVELGKVLNARRED